MFYEPQLISRYCPETFTYIVERPSRKKSRPTETNSIRLKKIACGFSMENIIYHLPLVYPIIKTGRFRWRLSFTICTNHSHLPKKKSPQKLKSI